MPSLASQLPQNLWSSQILCSLKIPVGAGLTAMRPWQSPQNRPVPFLRHPATPRPWSTLTNRRAHARLSARAGVPGSL